MLASMTSCLSWLQAPRFRRSTTILSALILTIVTIVLLVNPASDLKAIGHSKPVTEASGTGYPRCSDRTDTNITYPLESWREAAETKFGGLMDDKFTYVQG